MIVIRGGVRTSFTRLRWGGGREEGGREGGREGINLCNIIVRFRKEASDRMYVYGVKNAGR
jgi:hypothetical protein